MLLRPEGRLDAAISAAMVAVAEIALVIGATGAVGALRRGPVVAATIVLAVATSLVAWRRWPPSASRSYWLRDLARARAHPWSTALVVLALAGLAWESFVALVLPPYAYDALMYHLPIVDTWLQRGDIAPVEVSLCCSHYANNAELFPAWVMLLGGNDSLVDLVQVPFAVLCGLATAGLARSAGLPRHAAAAAGALVVTMPIVLAQSSTNYVDVMATAWALVALHAIVRFSASRNWRRLVVGAVSIGLLLGTKGTGLVWGAVLLVGVGVVLVGLAVRDARWRPQAVRTGAGVLALAAAFGSFWYARNWIDTGNPLHPFRIELAGREIFDGSIGINDYLVAPNGPPGQSEAEAVARSWAADVDFWRQGNYDYQQRAGGLGPVWPWLAIPSLVPFVVVLARRRSLLLIAVGIVAVELAVQPFRWWSRFTIQPAALGAVAVAFVAVAANAPWLRRTVRAAALGLATAGVLLTTRAVAPAGNASPLAAGDVIRLAGEPPAARTLDRLFFPDYAFVHEIPDGGRVALDVAAAPIRFLHPLFGDSWQRAVVPDDGAAARTDTWYVTKPGARRDRSLRTDRRFELVSVFEEAHVWRPREQVRR